MAKEIIALDQSQAGTGMFTVRVAFWVTMAQPVPVPNATSAWQGASAGDLAAIQAGTILEVVLGFTFPNGTPAATIKSVLQSAYTALQAGIPSKGQYYGIFFDSVNGWSA